MEESELEEGEACSYHNNNDYDGSSINPDIDLSYIDEKIKDVLGHFQKDFEGGVSAENLGAKFGGYGSFLPTYQRSPAWPHPKTPPKAQNHSTPRSPNNLQGERGCATSSTAPKAVRAGPSSSSVTSLPALKASSSNDSSKQKTSVISIHAETSASRPEFANRKSSVLYKQNSLKFRLKVVPDNLWTEKNAEIYNGLGLGLSPSSSPDNSTSESEGMYSEPQDFPFESPSTILMEMTSLPVPRDQLLSPLTDDLIHLTERETTLKDDKFVPVSGRFGPESSHVMLNDSDARKSDEKALAGKKVKSIERNNRSVEASRRDKRNVLGGTNGVARKEVEMDPPFGREAFNDGVKGKGGDNYEKGYLDPIHGREPLLDDNLRTSSAGSVKEDRKSSSFDGISDYPRKEGKYKGAKTSDSVKRDSSASKGKKTPKADVENFTRQRASENEQESAMVLKEKEHQLPGGKKKSRDDQILAAPETKKNAHSDYSATKKESLDLKSQKDVRKAEDTYKDFFGDMLESDEEEQISSLEVKGSRKTEKRTSAIDNASERFSNKKSDKLMSEPPKAVPSVAPPSFSKPCADAPHANSNPILIKEHWVLCDRCDKWRLLPLGMNPDNLPKKWICAMLDWLPGKNNCNVPEEETTRAVIEMCPPAPPKQDIMQSNHIGAISQINLEDITKKRKKGLKEITNETDQDGSTHSMDNAKKNMQASARNGSISHSHSVSKPDYCKSSVLPLERHKHKQKERLKVADQHSAGGDTRSSKMKGKRDFDGDNILLSKKLKTESFLFSDEDRTSEHGGAMRNGRPSSSSGLPASSAGKDRPRYSKHPKDSRSNKKPKGDFLVSKDNGSLNMGNSDSSSAKRKRKLKESHATQLYKEELSENEHGKEKKVRLNQSEGKESSIGQGNVKSERKTVSYSKRDFGPVQHSAAATSSSSKISNSHKNKTSFHEAKGSPVESVSSSPMRISDPDKDASERRKQDESHDTNFRTMPNSRRYSDGEDGDGSNRLGAGEKNNKHGSHESSVFDFRDKDFNFSHSTGKAKELNKLSPSIKNHHFGNGSSNDLPTKDHSHDEGRQSSDHRHSIGSQPRKSGQGSSSRSKDKNQSTRSDSKDDLRYVDKKIPAGKLSGESSKRESQINLAGLDNADTRVDMPKPNVPKHYDGERWSKRILSDKSDKAEMVSEREVSLSRPPSRGAQDEMLAHHPNKVDRTGMLAGESSQVDMPKAPMQTRRNDSSGNSLQNGQSPSSLRKELSSSQAASNALKEAKDLKHMADRLKNAGSNLESIGLYFQAALKFLHGASLLESCSSESARHGEMTQSMQIYSSTAKLCGFCAHEYEKSKDMAAAALAYKCMEVAYMRVVHSSHTSTNRYRHELQTALQMVPPGESPSSSASDVDNLNHPAAADKVVTSRGVNSPQVAGSHVISAQNRPNLLRLLQLAQDVSFAMDASRKSRIAFAATNGNLGEARYGEGSISSIKSALDYNFQDVEGLVKLVRIAMEAINR